MPLPCECATCGDDIENIVDLLDHGCDAVLSVDALSGGERSTLLYIESRVVDNNALLDREQTNYEDDQNIKLFGAAGLLDVVHVGEVEAPSSPHHIVADEVTTFTDEAWDLAAACRKRRGEKNLQDEETAAV